MPAPDPRRISESCPESNRNFAVRTLGFAGIASRPLPAGFTLEASHIPAPLKVTASSSARQP